jgi:hypothetical protein
LIEGLLTVVHPSVAPELISEEESLKDTNHTLSFSWLNSLWSFLTGLPDFSPDLFRRKENIL